VTSRYVNLSSHIKLDSSRLFLYSLERDFSSQAPIPTQSNAGIDKSPQIQTSTNKGRPNPYVSPKPPQSIGKGAVGPMPQENAIGILNNIILQQKKRAEEKNNIQNERTTKVPPIEDSNASNAKKYPSFARRQYTEFPNPNVPPDPPTKSTSPPPLKTDNPYIKKDNSFGAVQEALKKAININSSKPAPTQRTYETLAELFEFTLKKRAADMKVTSPTTGKKYTLEDIFGAAKAKPSLTYKPSTSTTTTSTTPTSPRVSEREQKNPKSKSSAAEIGNKTNSSKVPQRRRS